MYPREPFNVITHLIGFLLSVGVAYFFFYAKRDLSLLIFAASLILCYMFSSIYHAVNCNGKTLEVFHTLDKTFIYTLLAGTYTPILIELCNVRALASVWVLCGLAIARLWTSHQSRIETTLLMMIMGWGFLLLYNDFNKKFNKEMGLLIGGGISYTIGSIINILSFPNITFAHGVFHLMVILGSAMHVTFIYRIILRKEPENGFTNSPVEC